MPPTSAAAAKKQPLTLEQISKYDDILTDCLVDQTFYSSTIPKNRTTYHPSRGLKEDQITKIIQQHLIVEPNLDVATEKLLALDGLRKFQNALKTPKEKDDFQKHLRRYAQIYLPDCPFEVSTTNRYTIVTYEAAVTARRFIKRGESIKYLSGIQVLITPKEEDEMTKRKKDFSIVVSSRSKCASLFMGPARFANHDCDANARLVITSHSTIEIFATKNIDLGDEITVTYGDNYFGEDNCECLCHTCETNLANGWAQPDEALSTGLVTRSIEDAAEEGYRLRRRRRDDSAARSSREPSRTPDIRRRVSRSKTKLMRTDSTQGSTAGSPAPEARLRQMKKREFEMLSSPPATPAKRHKSAHFDATPLRAREEISLNITEGETSGSDSTTTVESDKADSPETEVTLPDEETIVPELSLQSPRQTPTKVAYQVTRNSAHTEVKTENMTAVDQSSGSIVHREVRRRKIFDPVRNSIEEAAATGIPAASVPDVDKDVDIIAPDDLDLMVIAPPLTPASKPAKQEQHEAEESIELPVKRGRGRPKGSNKSKRVADDNGLDDANELPPATFSKPTVPISTSNRSVECAPSDDGEAPVSKNVRRPGDYTLTPLLLPVADSAWNWCRTCDSAFVQHEAYFTRAYCPRCERHSKLYGYRWPKTQKDGKNDKEERVLDHREIHRFLDPEEEARIRGRKYLGQLPGQSKPEIKAPVKASIVKKAPVKAGPQKKRRSSAVKDKDEDYRCSEECEDDRAQSPNRSTRLRRASIKA